MSVNENSRDALIIFSVALATFMARLDSYIVNVSLPTMARYFDSSLSDISRVAFIYDLPASSTLLLFGKLAERTGLRKKMPFDPDRYFAVGESAAHLSVNREFHHLHDHGGPESRK